MVVDGSSPRVWGTLLICCAAAHYPRFIPACVGNSFQLFKDEDIVPVHPRVCGELSSVGHLRVPCCGSSPRVWGTQVLKPSMKCLARFIPACVGNSVPGQRCPTGHTVHPRVCGGELSTMSDTLSVGAGSSPRVWGTQCHAMRPQWRGRFIPACVGNSQGLRHRPTAGQVHPRVCGELVQRFSVLRNQIGSSPRVWGTRSECGRWTPDWRFIPACVGNSPKSITGYGAIPVHPRVCGELSLNSITYFVANGSSPRVWGTRMEVSFYVYQFRFIPACVGNSQPHRLG